MRRLGRVTNLVVILIIALSGLSCSSSTDQTRPTSTAERASGAATTPSATGTTSKKAPQGTVTVAIGADVEAMDPHKISGGASYFVWAAAVESLTGIDPSGKIVPRLAESYRILNDGRDYEFTLRKGVKFHNGDTMTAKDVKFSFERATSPDLKAPNIGFTNMVDRLEVVDDYKVIYHLKNPDVMFPVHMSNPIYTIVPSEHVKKVGNEEFAKHPILTGPFKFIKREVLQSFTLEAFEDYWGTVPSIKTVILKIVPEAQARVTMLKTGEADIVHSLPPFLTKEVENTPGLRVERSRPMETIVITIDCSSAKGKSSPFTNKKVRQALNHAVDKEALVKNVLMGSGEVLRGWVPRGEVGYDETLVPYAYDPKKAKALLADAGYPDGFVAGDIMVPSGRWPMGEEVTEAVANYLTAVGIKASPKTVEYNTWISSLRAQDFYPLAFQGNLDGVADPGRNIPTWFRLREEGGTWNQCPDPEESELAKASAQEMDPAKREVVLKKLFRLDQENATKIFLYESVYNFGLSNRVEWKPWTGAPYIILTNASLKK